MTKQQKIELVTRYLNGETPEELASAFATNPTTIRYNLTHIYQPRSAGRKINIDECAYPGLAMWLKSNGYSASWLAERIGVTKQMMHYYMRGYNKIPERRIGKIQLITGLTKQQMLDMRKEA